MEAEGLGVPKGQLVKHIHVAEQMVKLELDVGCAEILRRDLVTNYTLQTFTTSDRVMLRRKNDPTEDWFVFSTPDEVRLITQLAQGYEIAVSLQRVERYPSRSLGRERDSFVIQTMAKDTVVIPVSNIRRYSLRKSRDITDTWILQPKEQYRGRSSGIKPMCLDEQQALRIIRELNPDSKIWAWAEHDSTSQRSAVAHGLQDASGRTYIWDEKMVLRGMRYGGADGSGRSLEQKDLSEAKQDQMIRMKAESIVATFLARTDLLPQDALDEADRIERADTRNPAYAAGMCFDLLEDELRVSGQGDLALILVKGFNRYGKPLLYRDRRFFTPASSTYKKHRSPAQLVTSPHNVAAVKAFAGMIKDKEVATDLGSNSVYRVIGDAKSDVSKATLITIPRKDVKAEFALIVSDGARPHEIIDFENPTKYQQAVMNTLAMRHRRELTVDESSRAITASVRKIGGDKDDVTVTLIHLREIWR